MRRLRLFILLLAFLVAPPSAAQTAPGAADVLRAWSTRQQTAAAGVERIVMDEAVRTTVDGGFGARRLAVRVRLSARPGGDDGWTRTILEAELNDRAIDPARGERVESRYRAVGRDGERLLDALLLPAGLLRRFGPMRPEASAEQIDGRPAWRVDLAAPEGAPDARVERITLWFGRTDGRLLRSLALLHAPEPPGRREGRRGDDRDGGRAGRPSGDLTVTTDYLTVRGIDLPAERSVSGVLRTRRRTRSLTFLVESSSRFDGHRVE